MATYLICYDYKNGTDEDYNRLDSALSSVFDWWCHFQGSVWIVKSALPTPEILNKIAQEFSSGSKIMVIAVGRNAAWKGLDSEDDEWLRNNL